MTVFPPSLSHGGDSVPLPRPGSRFLFRRETSPLGRQAHSHSLQILFMLWPLAGEGAVDKRRDFNELQLIATMLQKIKGRESGAC